MATDIGRSATQSGHSAEPEPISVVSAKGASVPSAWHIKLVWEPKGEAWVAQALEHDIAAQGSTILAALTNLGYTIIAEHNFTEKRWGAPFATIPPAPLELFASFAQAIEARRAETPKSGSVADESAVGNTDAPNNQSSSTTQHGDKG